jgi:ribonuclease HI
VIEIYTDGACRGNPGPGGWGALLIMGENEKELNGAEALTTNNRMELTAVIRALEALKRPVAAWTSWPHNTSSNGAGSRAIPGWRATSESINWRMRRSTHFSNAPCGKLARHAPDRPRH